MSRFDTPDFHDGIREAAERSHNGNSNSYHVPSGDNPYAGFIILGAVVIIMAIGIAAIGAVR